MYAISPGQIVKDFFEFPDNFNDVLENKEQIKTFLEHFIKEKSNDISPLVHSFEKMFDYDRFIHSNIEYACMTYNVSKMQAQPFYKKTYHVNRQSLSLWRVHLVFQHFQ